jgi:hypothetical protein
MKRQIITAQIEPDCTGLLTDDDIGDLGKIKIGIVRIRNYIERVNEFARATGLRIRPLSELTAILAENDIIVLMCAHERAEDRIKSAAFAALEKAAAK